MCSGRSSRCASRLHLSVLLAPAVHPLPQLLYERTVGSGVGVLTNLVDGMCRWVGPVLLSVHAPGQTGGLRKPPLKAASAGQVALRH